MQCTPLHCILHILRFIRPSSRKGNRLPRTTAAANGSDDQILATPDFLAGVEDLRASSCEKFNEVVKDSPQVYYQSVMSRMACASSAGFPLNLGYLLSKKYEGANDGLVSVTSAQWGEFRELISTKRQGVSHGDMIDLMRRNIKGFDVSEFYVKLFEDLKNKGF